MIGTDITDLICVDCAVKNGFWILNECCEDICYILYNPVYLHHCVFFLFQSGVWPRAGDVGSWWTVYSVVPVRRKAKTSQSDSLPVSFAWSRLLHGYHCSRDCWSRSTTTPALVQLVCGLLIWSMEVIYIILQFNLFLSINPFFRRLLC